MSLAHSEFVADSLTPFTVNTFFFRTSYLNHRLLRIYYYTWKISLRDSPASLASVEPKEVLSLSLSLDQLNLSGKKFVFLVIASYTMVAELIFSFFSSSKSISVLKRASRKATFPTRIPKVSFITKRTAFHFTANQILLREGDKDSCPRCWVSEDIEKSSGFLTNGHFLVAHVPEPEPTRKIR